MKCGSCNRRDLQGIDKIQLASGLCEWCYEQTPEGRVHYQRLSQVSKQRLGLNGRSIVSGDGDQ